MELIDVFFIHFNT